MRVRMGWSGETEPNTWQKVDVELEEEDLSRIIRDHNLPDDLSERLPTRICFQLMQNEAEALLLGKLRNIGYPEDKAQNRMELLHGSTKKIVEHVKNRLAMA